MICHLLQNSAADLEKNGRLKFVTFHQSYGYEEFIEGIKPSTENEADGNGNIKYSVESGVFRTSMTVNICNEGPVTIMLDSKKTF